MSDSKVPVNKQWLPTLTVLVPASYFSALIAHQFSLPLIDHILVLCYSASVAFLFVVLKGESLRLGFFLALAFCTSVLAVKGTNIWIIWPLFFAIYAATVLSAWDVLRRRFHREPCTIECSDQPE